MSAQPHSPTEPVIIHSAERARDAGFVPSVGGISDAPFMDSTGDITKPAEYPQDVWDVALRAAVENAVLTKPLAAMVAEAVMAERKRCAAEADAEILGWHISGHLGRHSAILAAKAIARRIRKGEGA